MARYKAVADMAAGKYGAALMGWVPQKAKGKVEEALGRLRDQIVYTFEPVDEHHEGHQVPVTLENPAWAKPFELLHGFLNTPAYGSHDPTVMIAIFFPLFFELWWVISELGCCSCWLPYGWPGSPVEGRPCASIFWELPSGPMCWAN